MLELSLSENRSLLLKLWRVYLGLATLQCLGALVLAWRLRAYTGDTFGLIQLIFTGFVLFFLMSLIALLIQAWMNQPAADRRIQAVLRFVQHPNRFAVLTVLTSIVFLMGVFTATLTPELSEPFTQAILVRALPIALLAAGLSLQTLAFLLVLRHGFSFQISGPKIFWSILILSIGMFLFWSWLATTVIPSASQVEGWNTMGIPILELQVLAAWLLGMGTLLLINLVNTQQGASRWIARMKSDRIDLVISLLIWIITILIWQSIPIQPNWFLTDQVFPTNESYPSSDARLYDRVAQSALVGAGYRFNEDFNIRRPLHGLYLTILHIAAGQNYQQLVFLQIILLSAFPVILFWMVKNLHNRISGVIAAALVIFRESNAIALSGDLTTANAKLLLVDLPTALMVALFFYIAILWLRKAPANALWAFVTGQALGLAILLRPETMILGAAPAFVLFMVMRGDQGYGKFLRQLALFTIGLLLVLSPWVWRNWRQTGLIYLNDPYFRFGIIRQRFGPESFLPTPDETQDDIVPNRVVVVPQLTGGGTNSALPGYSAGQQPDDGTHPMAFQPALELQATPTPGPRPRTPEEIEQIARERLIQELRDPLRLIQINSAHFLNSQFQTLLIFPSAFRGLDSLIGFAGHRTLPRFWSECCSTIGYVRRLSYWPSWEGGFDLQSLVPLSITLVLIAAGIQTAWNKRGWVGLLLLLGATIHLFGNAIFRNSGGRYILSVDWIFIAYYSIGLAQLSSAALGYLRGAEIHTQLPGEQDQARRDTRSATGSWLPAGLAVCLLVVSLSIPLVESSFPRLYPVLRKAQMLEALLASDELTSGEKQILQFYLDQGIITVGGRVLYPQYFPEDIGSLGKKNAPIEPMPFRRLVFTITGERSIDLILPVEDQPAPILNAADGVVFVCPDDEDYALALGILDSQNRVQSVTFISPEIAKIVCPLNINSNPPP